MDGDDLESEPSEITLTEFFIKMFPFYMNMGMSYDEYWNGPCWLVRSYREAHQMKQRQEEWARWRQGAYIFDALLCASPMMKSFVKDAKPGKYPEEPWPLTQKEADEQQAERDRKGYEQALARRRAASDAELKRRAEAKKQEVSKDGND